MSKQCIVIIKLLYSSMIIITFNFKHYNYHPCMHDRQSNYDESRTMTSVMVTMYNNYNLYTCSQCQGSILFTGEWSTEGCETNFNSTSTVCRCNHLTHFAILLSARPLSDLSQTHILALQITGYIGVSVSLVAMAATIFAFLFLK